MTRREQIHDIVSRTVAEAAGLDREAVGEDQDLLSDLAMDSLAIFEVVVDLETHYRLRIPDEAIDQLRTIRLIVDYIEAETR